MTPEAVTALAGLVASFLSGLLGIGGGLVLTPLLLYLPQLFGGAAHAFTNAKFAGKTGPFRYAPDAARRADTEAAEFLASVTR